MITISVGTKATCKILAVEIACRQLEIKALVVPAKANPSINEQPEGFRETYLGASTRAYAAKEVNFTGVAVGIESGIFSIPVKDHSLTNDSVLIMDFAVIVVIAKDGREIVTTSSGLVFPNEYVEIARERGFKTTTVGSVIAEKLGGKSADPHATLTNNRVTRYDTLVEALMVAFKQL